MTFYMSKIAIKGAMNKKRLILGCKFVKKAIMPWL